MAKNRPVSVRAVFFACVFFPSKHVIRGLNEQYPIKPRGNAFVIRFFSLSGNNNKLQLTFLFICSKVVAASLNNLMRKVLEAVHML